MICTTLNKIREHAPCPDGWKKLLAGLNKTGPDDELLPLVRILEINGLDDALWALRTTDDCDREARLLAVAYARQVQHLMNDARSIACLDVAERFANGKATPHELIEAQAAAYAAWNDARASAYAADATWDAAWTTAWAADAAVWAAAVNAVDAAADAADAARAAADAARGCFGTAMCEKQVELFKEVFG